MDGRRAQYKRIKATAARAEKAEAALGEATRVLDDLNAWLIRTDREGTAHQQLAAAFLAKQAKSK